MHYTIKLGRNASAELQALPGFVDFNGLELAPHEAVILADALTECAQRAERQAAAVIATTRAAALSAAARH